MISHKFDTSCLYITLPELYEPQPIALDYGSVLDEVMKQIFANSIHVRLTHTLVDKYLNNKYIC